MSGRPPLRGRGGRSGGGGRSSGSGKSKGVAASVGRRSSGEQPSSPNSSNPSSSGSGSVSQTPRSSLPIQYPNHTQPQQQLHVLHPQQHHAQNSPPQAQFPQPQHQQPPIQFPAPPQQPLAPPQQPPAPPQQPPDPQEQSPAPQEQPPAPEPLHEDHQQLLDALLALPGREHLPLLSKHRIAGVKTLWFGRDNGNLPRVIAGIFRRKFVGPYYSWKVTPIHIQEIYFRSFARKYTWEIGITELVKQGFLKVAKNRMKDIVSQVKRGGKRPHWIIKTLWSEMLMHWSSPKAVDRSVTASLSRNSDCGGLGPHKHLSGQKTYVQRQEDMVIVCHQF
ncbi:hypothetical protein N665_5970s0001 [Sinapis alba]|nr:hypothetical protein N665_5970s0001 [Sinapis alba]